MILISANAAESSCKHCTAQLEQKTAKHEPFVIQRLYPATSVKSDCARAIQMAAQRAEVAMDTMIEQDRITFFAVGTKVYPVKSTDMGTWWLVREKGSAEQIKGKKEFFCSPAYFHNAALARIGATHGLGQLLCLPLQRSIRIVRRERLGYVTD